jgi:hypothetical protein
LLTPAHESKAFIGLSKAKQSKGLMQKYALLGARIGFLCNQWHFLFFAIQRRENAIDCIESLENS